MFQFPKSKEEWLEIAERFEKKWNFINCGGALDGKHIRIFQPANTGAQYYNYKHFYSIVLMALVNADHEFIFIDVGKNGRISDGGIIEYTEFYKRLTSGLLNIPNVMETKNNLNFVFLGDEAFALSKHFLRPFPRQNLNYERQIFNYRLSRARNVSENTFGLLSSRFRILNTSINMAPEKVQCIVLAICALHNCFSKRSSTYVTPSTYDRDNATMTNAIQGDWRKEANNFENLQALIPRKVEADAVRNRNNYMAYFNNDGRVPWQDEMLKRGVV